jgi:hypothetical protein
MQYVYFIRLRGMPVILLKTATLIDSPKELYRQVAADPMNFQRVYDSATPTDVGEVILSENIFEFLLCGDIHFFRKWLRSELLNKNYQCFAIQDSAILPSRCRK